MADGWTASMTVVYSDALAVPAFVKNVKPGISRVGVCARVLVSLVFDRLGAPRSSLPIAAGVLLGLLSVLATLQYRWLGQVAEAERGRLQAGARARVEQFASEFDREITRAFAAFRVEADILGDDGGARLADRYQQWAGRAEYPGLVAAVYVAEMEGSGAPRLRRLDPAARALVEAAWTPVLESMKAGMARPEHGGPGGPRGPLALAGQDSPVLMIPIAETGRDDQRPPHRGEPGDVHFGPRRPRGITIVVLDGAYMRRVMLPALAARHVAGSDDLDYAVAVTTRRDPRTVVFRSEGAVDGLRPDATAALLEVRFDQLEPGLPRGFGAPGGPRHGPGPRPDHGLWEASVTHRGGSLEAVVSHVRRRNLAISFGILLLLGASAAMVVLSSQNARRLAEQQVEFVAGVSHELRTPVAILCSAGENLADGLVRDPAEVRLYGATIRDEGRRLAEMVEQVLEFAGITSRERLRAREAVALPEIVREAVQASSVLLRESGVEVEVDVPRDLPEVMGDGAALRRAVQNLVQNAARHAASGRWIGISARAAASAGGSVVRLGIADRGPGITPADGARLFEPFFRGRQALRANVAGSGLGLTLVKRIVESHGGAIEVVTTPGEGTTFTIVLPAGTMSTAAASSTEESDAQADPAR
jgi:signal transduction histidine kinase